MNGRPHIKQIRSTSLADSSDSRDDACRAPARFAARSGRVRPGCVNAWLSTSATVEGLARGRACWAAGQIGESAHPGQRVSAKDRLRDDRSRRRSAVRCSADRWSYGGWSDPSDFLITWQQLGSLATRAHSMWLVERCGWCRGQDRDCCGQDRNLCFDACATFGMSQACVFPWMVSER